MQDCDTVPDLTGAALSTQQKAADHSFSDSPFLFLLGCSSFWHSESDITKEALFCLTALSDAQ